MLERLERLLKEWLGGTGVPIWYDPAFRLPVSGIEGRTGIEPRRADYVAWFLVQTGATTSSQLMTPEPIAYEHLALVHTHEYLESLGHPETLAGIIGVEPSFVPVDEVLRTVRLACGGTLAATRWALDHRRPALNLLGGFHHAGPDFGADLCPVNDVACALAVVRREGFSGRVAVVDLDAHPPDGTAACLGDDPDVWIGSISTATGGSLQGVHAFDVPAGCDNATYRRAFEDLLDAVPRVDLAFVVAGGDVLAGDRFGDLRLNLEGARRRDLALARHLEGVPGVWLPGGGYHRDSWKVLAGTALVLIDGSLEPISDDYDPMGERYARISKELDLQDSADDDWISADDLVQALRLPLPRREKLLDRYTAEAVEYALDRFGILPHLRRLGYDRLRVVLDGDRNADRLRILGSAAGAEHLLVECVLAREPIAGVEMLYVHWLTLRNPLAAFSGDRRKMPGQEVPGLGMAREAGEVLIRIAMRLNLMGLAFRPAWYHTAYAGRYYLRFVDPARQGRFEALMRDLAGVPMLAATTALAEGKVLMDGRPYTWEANLMAHWLSGGPDDAQAVAAERERVRFGLEC